MERRNHKTRLIKWAYKGHSHRILLIFHACDEVFWHGGDGLDHHHSVMLAAFSFAVLCYALKCSFVLMARSSVSWVYVHFLGYLFGVEGSYILSSECPVFVQTFLYEGWHGHILSLLIFFQLLGRLEEINLLGGNAIGHSSCFKSQNKSIHKHPLSSGVCSWS